VRERHQHRHAGAHGELPRDVRQHRAAEDVEKLQPAGRSRTITPQRPSSYSTVMGAWSEKRWAL
jgi:hypothetical protein